MPPTIGMSTPDVPGTIAHVADTPHRPNLFAVVIRTATGMYMPTTWNAIGNWHCSVGGTDTPGGSYRTLAQALASSEWQACLRDAATGPSEEFLRSIGAR
jgi:hypothetical protein